MVSELRDRFVGCMLGLAVGDALGACFEGQSSDWIASRFASAQALVDKPPVEELWYTDDTQMAIGVAEVLVSNRAIDELHLCRAFVENYVPTRGYGRGARRVIEAMEAGEDHRRVAETYFPGGSFGNGAAMRVAPVGLLFGDDPAQLLEQARLSSLPTHTHALGVEGAQLLALAVGTVSRLDKFVRSVFYSVLIGACRSPEYRSKLEAAAALTSVAELSTLGNGIEAVQSVPTAIACFACNSMSFEATIGEAIWLGGDTDTIAAMAGALAGAHLGASAIPQRLLAMLEDVEKGRSYIERLANELYAARAVD